MKNKQLKPTGLRTMMIVVIIMIGSVLVAGFYYAQSWLSDMSISVNRSNSSSVTNTDSSQSVNQLRNDISSQKAAADKAASLTLLKQEYETQIQKDLNKYASDTGIKISDYKTVSSPATGTMVSQIAGVQVNFVSVTINDPVNYTDLLKFIKAIETNVPKMKLTGINITNSGASDGLVKVDPLIIEVYTR